MLPLLALAHDHFAYRGGGEIMLLRVAGLAAKAARLRLELLWARDRGTLSAEDSRLFETLETLDLPAKLHWRTAMAQQSRLKSLEGSLAAAGARAILAFSLRSAIRLAPIAKRLGIAMAWMCQQSFPLFSPPLQGLKQFLGLRRLLAARTRIVCISDEAREGFRRLGFSEGQIHLIRNGIDFERFSSFSLSPDARAARLRELGLDGMDLIVAFVARLDPIKNHSTLLKALAAAREKGARIGALLVGGRAPHAPGHEDQLRRESGQLRVAEQIVWAGECADVRPWLALAGAAVLPSWKEAAGLVLAEAGAAGLPLLGSRVGGIPEIVRDGETGGLFAPGDPQALAEGLLLLASRPDRRAALGEGARQWVREEFNAVRQDRLWEQFIAELLNLQSISSSTRAT